MAWFLGLGIGGIVVLALSLIFDGVLEGLFGGVLAGPFDGLLSLPVIAGFLSMFGFAGAIVHGGTGLGTAAAVGVGLAAGTAAGAATWRFSRTLMDDRTDPAPRREDLVGTAGSVITPIPTDGYGEVLLQLAGHPVKLSARSAVPVARGAEIWVEASLSSTAVAVRPVER
ncbi:hypothetical protein ACFC0M_04485 [Streptomyces sp. NPDC056149]|uniref:hypothetical protein n=1 Tax=Streptomyces sp. NPDC056149 TaxID=3345728 RepID=UPI0035DC2F71